MSQEKQKNISTWQLCDKVQNIYSSGKWISSSRHINVRGSKTTFTYARSSCGAETGGFLHSRPATAGMFTHTRSGRGGSAISWGQRGFMARGFEADAENWVSDPFVAERILLPLCLRSATAYVWSHAMICVEANFPSACARVRSAHVWTYEVPGFVHSCSKVMGFFFGMSKSGS